MYKIGTNLGVRKVSIRQWGWGTTHSMAGFKQNGVHFMQIQYDSWPWRDKLK